jgi:mRNA interferase MazF
MGSRGFGDTAEAWPAMKAGSVHWINLEPAHPPELGKVRPAIVVSNEIYNERLDSIVVIPLSTRAPEIWPLRLRVAAGRLKASFAVVPGVRQVSKARLHELIGRVPDDVLRRVREALSLYLGD